MCLLWPCFVRQWKPQDSITLHIMFNLTSCNVCLLMFEILSWDCWSTCSFFHQHFLSFFIRPTKHLHYNAWPSQRNSLLALWWVAQGKHAPWLQSYPSPLYISPQLCPLSSSAPAPHLAAVWNPEWHFKVLSVSWDQACISIRNRDWP